MSEKFQGSKEDDNVIALDFGSVRSGENHPDSSDEMIDSLPEIDNGSGQVRVLRPKKTEKTDLNNEDDNPLPPAA